jgi:hypothetical protein
MAGSSANHPSASAGLYKETLGRVGHELPRRSLTGAAAKPSITDLKAVDWRGRDGPKPDPASKKDRELSSAVGPP